jgi:hypothetical protein
VKIEHTSQSYYHKAIPHGSNVENKNEDLFRLNLKKKLISVYFFLSTRRIYAPVYFCFNMIHVQCLTTDWTIGVLSPARAKDFSYNLCVQTGSEAHPASCPMGTGGPFPGGKERPGCDANHSPSSSAEVVHSKSYTSSPPKRLHGV